MSGNTEIEPVVGDFDGARAPLAFFPDKTHRRRLIGEETARETVGLDDDPVIGVVAADDEVCGFFSRRGLGEDRHKSLRQWTDSMSIMRINMQTIRTKAAIPAKRSSGRFFGIVRSLVLDFIFVSIPAESSADPSYLTPNA
jgi:hypothetical protein